MSWDLGDVVIPTPFEVRVGGVLTAATVVLTVTAPDGTVTTPAVTSPSTGVYTSKVPATQAGDWQAVWVATGAVDTRVLPDQWSVTALGLRLLSLAEAKEHLGKTGITDDEELRRKIDAITAVVEHQVGPVVVREFTDTVTVSGEVMVLGRAPAVELVSVTAAQSAVTAPVLADLTLEPETGLVYYTAGGSLPCGRMQVTYTAGRTPIPGAIREAALVILADMWSTQRGSGSSARAVFNPGDDVTAAERSYAASGLAARLLEPFRSAPAVA